MYNTDDEIISLRHTLHRYPELSCHEEKTAEILMAFLKKHSPLEIVPCGKWFYALYSSRAENKRPSVAFRADMDALPMDESISLPYASENQGAAHKCGHDGHCAALAYFGCMLESLKPDRDVYLVFQHGEEIGAGGEECSRLLEEKNIREVYACHNWSGFPLGQVLVRAGTSQCASQGLIVSFEGRASHASQPENGVNPASALSELALFVNSTAGYRRESKDGILAFATVVGINAGGRNFGMSASSGEICLTLRAERDGDMAEIKGNIIAKAKALAEKEGLSVSFKDVDVFPDTICSAEGAEKVKKAAASLRLSCRMMEKPFRASEDFGYYLKKCSGAIFYIGNGVDYPEIHTEAYDFPDENLKNISEMFAAICTGREITM